LALLIGDAVDRTHLIGAVVSRTGLSETDATAAVDVILDELEKPRVDTPVAKAARPSSHSLPPEKQHDIAQST